MKVELTVRLFFGVLNEIESPLATKKRLGFKDYPPLEAYTISRSVKRSRRIGYQVGHITLQMVGFEPLMGQFHEPVLRISERQVEG